jgi:hypothetical protein
VSGSKVSMRLFVVVLSSWMEHREARHETTTGRRDTLTLTDVHRPPSVFPHFWPAANNSQAALQPSSPETTAPTPCTTLNCRVNTRIFGVRNRFHAQHKEKPSRHSPLQSTCPYAATTTRADLTSNQDGCSARSRTRPVLQMRLSRCSVL